ncbi:hypothetical protein PRIPAC_79970 [Pristionchus pacificus]|uniref:Uncharacterized protein n=1 Tax=Pristionchus pacificus TaxID=54126 RepID=A0A2A6CBU0_PRIPA|nr:hypothetical protein PRIPAC_79970 [Pristionchus pacificus]|eukprot:PDM75609.1 hypothetical protein PRIPAC_42786 [Pristionchus pacificus]
MPPAEQTNLERLKGVYNELLQKTTNDKKTKEHIKRKESVVRIEVAIQTFLKVFGKLRLVINRGEDMSDDHVVGITPSFDRMQREIVNMPPLNCLSALEVIETGLHQLGIEDRRGQEGLDQWKEGPMDRHR